MREDWKCNNCGGMVGGGRALDEHHERAHRGGWDPPSFTRVDEKPSTKLTPGARVSFEHEGVVRTGMVWAEAPAIVGPKGGKGKPQRHVIPDGERHAVQVPVHKLTQLEDAVTAAKAPPHLFNERRIGA